MKANKRRAGGGGGSKRELIEQALASDHAVVALRQLALSPGGLLAHRESAWNVLLQLEADPLPAAPSDEKEVPPKTLHQIGLDVARSYGHLPEEEGSEKRAELQRFLTRYFAVNPALHYYQGFHDVAMVVLEVFPNAPHRQLAAMRQMSTHWVFCDAHDADFAKVQQLLLASQDLVGMVDFKYSLICNQFPFWGVSMLVCCFAHDVGDVAIRERIFDAVLASPPHFALYLVAALALLPRVKAQLSPPSSQDANPHETLRRTARSLTSIAQADELVELASSLARKVSPARLLLHAERKRALSRESIVFQPAALFPEWKPPGKPARWTGLALSVLVLALAVWWARQQQQPS